MLICISCTQSRSLCAEVNPSESEEVEGEGANEHLIMSKGGRFLSLVSPQISGLRGLQSGQEVVSRKQQPRLQRDALAHLGSTWRRVSPALEELMASVSPASAQAAEASSTSLPWCAQPLPSTHLVFPVTESHLFLCSFLLVLATGVWQAESSPAILLPYTSNRVVLVWQVCEVHKVEAHLTG